MSQVPQDSTSLLFSMTHSLRSAAISLLAPPPLFRPADLARDPDLVPSERGIYGWWFAGDLPGVPGDDCLERDGWRLLYVGVAPARTPRPEQRKVRSMRDRLKNHVRGPIATSTLRRSLAALLRCSLGFALQRAPNGKLRMPERDEARLSAWMDAHARVGWVTCGEPWLVEEALIADGPRLPLNLRGSSDPYRYELSMLRAAAGVPAAS